jgi:hypothetical protein
VINLHAKKQGLTIQAAIRELAGRLENVHS